VVVRLLAGEKARAAEVGLLQVELRGDSHAGELVDAQSATFERA
jgi:hypothetical protein